MDYRAELFKTLQHPMLAREYFIQAVQSGDPAVWTRALADIQAAGDGIYVPVVLTKFRSSPAAKVPSGRWDEYRCGDVTNDSSLPVDYTLTGLLLTPPQIGQCVIVLRWSRNEVAISGTFQSTPVVAVGAAQFTTQNSVYLMQPLPPLQTDETSHPV